MSKIFKIVIFIIALLYFGFAFYVVETKAQSAEIGIPCISGNGVVCPGYDEEKTPFVPGRGIEFPGYKYHEDSLFGLTGGAKQSFLKIMSISVLFFPIFFIIIFAFYVWDDETKQKNLGISKMVFNFKNASAFSFLSGFIFYFYIVFYFESYINNSNYYIEVFTDNFSYNFLRSFYSFLGVLISVFLTYYIFTLINYIKIKKLSNFIIYFIFFLPIIFLFILNLL